MFAPGMDHAARTEFIRDVRSGLGKGSQKELPSSYLYDEIGAVLFLFLGSTIGNFDREEAQKFLKQVRNRLAPGDALLLGTDLVKPVDQLLMAYNDSIGVTAAFNLNVLARINRELGGEFMIS